MRREEHALRPDQQGRIEASAKDRSQSNRRRGARWLAFLKHLTGLDRAIAFTVTARFWSAIAGIATVSLIARFLTPSEQGYYYTFYNLVALQVVFELGFSFVVLQLAAHERAQLTFLPDGRIEGNPIAHARLASVLQTSMRWYFVSGLLMGASLIPAGLYFFRSHQSTGAPVAWRIPWCLLVLAATLAFQVDPLFSFLEGCGYITQVAQRRLAQAMVGNLLAWTAMIVHRGLYAPAMVVLGQVSIAVAILFSTKLRRIIKSLMSFPVREHFVGWRSEIWPFQWKIAVSWLCGYFIFALFNPVLFAYQGPVVAGKMGMSLSISSAAAGIAIAWMNTKASPFGNLVARGDFAALDRLYFRTLLQSTALLLAGGTVLFLVVLVIIHRVPRFAVRILPPWAIAMLILTTAMNHIVTSEALYLRAHKREPFLGLSVTIAVLLGSATFLLGRYSGANAVVVGYFCIGGVISSLAGSFIFVAKRREWHRTNTQSQIRELQELRADD